MANAKEITLGDKLNNLAKSHMDQVPNDIRAQADNFVKEVAKAVESEVNEANKKVSKAEARAEAAEKRIGAGKNADSTEEKFYLEPKTSTEGTWKTIFRMSDSQRKPLYCIHPKKNQPVVCGAHCVGFKARADGNVELCNGSIRQIVERAE